MRSRSLIIIESGFSMKQPANPFHPGEILLEEFLQPAGITQTAFAKKLGWTRARLNELIRGKRGVTAEAALDLAEALGTSPKLWMNLQGTYDIARALEKRNAAQGSIQCAETGCGLHWRYSTEILRFSAVRCTQSNGPSMPMVLFQSRRRTGQAATSSTVTGCERSM